MLLKKIMEKDHCGKITTLSMLCPCKRLPVVKILITIAGSFLKFQN